jgi:hypothetical protein
MAITLNGNSNVSLLYSSGGRITGDFTNATLLSRAMFQTSTADSSTGIYALPSGTSTAASWQATNNADPTNASKVLIATNGTTDCQLVSGRNGSGTYLPLSFYTNGSQQMLLDTAGNLALGLNLSPSAWSTGKAIDIGFQGSSIWSATTAGNIFILSNAVYNGGYKFVTAAPASYYQQNAGISSWYTSTNTPTVGGAITFNQAMTLDSSGNLNIGNTSNAGAPLQVQVARTLSTNATAIILSDLAVGTQTNGVYKSIRSLSNNNNSVSEIRFLETDGTNNNTGIAFATQAVAGGLTERARIDYSGNLLVAKTSVGLAVGCELQSNGLVTSVRSGSTSATSSFQLYSTGASLYRFYVDMAGTVFATNTTISSLSDQRFKENIRDLDNGLDTILALKPRKFDWKEGKGKDIKNDRGFIAQEFEQVLPDLIDQWKDEPPESEEPYKAVRADLIPFLVKAIQELSAKVTALESKK